MKRILMALASPLMAIVVFGLAGAACVTYGVQLLAGEGWAYLTGGAFFLFLAGLISKGLNNG